VEFHIPNKRMTQSAIQLPEKTLVFSWLTALFGMLMVAALDGCLQKSTVIEFRGMLRHQINSPYFTRAFRRDHGPIRNLLLQQGGIAPALRIRGTVSLTLAEREDMSREIAAGESGRAIAERLGRAASTVCREIDRLSS